MITTDDLSAPRQGAVTELLTVVTDHDGVSPLDEAARLALSGTDAQHLLIEDAAAAAGTEVIAYASLLADGTAQGMVHPGHRRRGHGSALLRAVLEQRPDAGVWVHGALEGSLDFLKAHGLREQRRLLMLHRPLGAETVLPPVPSTTLEGLELDTFDVDRDADQWLEINASAFADHPEQGSLTRRDLDQRLAEPWFDPADLLIARQGEEMAGFVWIKREPRATTAEIYVVATAPSAQGHGVAGYLLATALHRLREAGVAGVELFVEGDNAPALALYERWGFTLSEQHVQLRAGEEG